MTPEWIDVAGGAFWMGAGPRDALAGFPGSAPRGAPRDNELPRHEVRLPPFRLARAPVTRGEYQAFLDATGRPAPPFWSEPAFAHPRMPAVGPSWEDAAAFCAWTAARSGAAVRLPSEAEWEHAARAGRDVVYPWGDDPPEALPDYDRRWREGPEPVDAYPSLHPLGFLGLGENVHEWCADWYDPGYYATSPVDDPRGPTSGVRRASRGGSWRHEVKVSRCAARSAIPPGNRYSDYGFRLAADASDASDAADAAESRAR